MILLELARDQCSNFHKTFVLNSNNEFYFYKNIINFLFVTTKRVLEST